VTAAIAELATIDVSNPASRLQIIQKCQHILESLQDPRMVAMDTLTSVRRQLFIADETDRFPIGCPVPVHRRSQQTRCLQEAHKRTTNRNAAGRTNRSRSMADSAPDAGGDCMGAHQGDWPRDLPSDARFFRSCCSSMCSRSSRWVGVHRVSRPLLTLWQREDAQNPRRPPRLPQGDQLPEPR
jgi:hypothetical protein